MGIRSLTGFVRDYRMFEQNQKLSSTLLVIDGVNLAMELYFAMEKSEKGKMFLYGGDYTLWANKVRNFFESLKSADVTPIVIFDGSFTGDKLEKKKSRFNDELKVLKDVCAGKSEAVLGDPNKTALLTPVLLRYVFWQVIKSMDLKHFYQVVENPPQVMIRIAQQLNAPLMSTSSNYLAANLPAGVIKTDVFVKHSEIVEDGDTKHVANVSIYKISKLQEHFPRLNLSLVLVPASAILGCDDINYEQAKKVVARLSLWKKERTEVVFDTFKWLSHFTDVNEIVAEFRRLGVARDVVEYVRQRSALCVDQERVDLSVEEYFAKFHDELFLVAAADDKIPLWLQTLIVKHRLLSNLVPIIIHKIDLYEPMIEDISQYDCASIPVFALADRILGLLRPKDAKSFEIRRYCRLGGKMQMGTSNPAKELPNGEPMPSLEELKSMNTEERFTLLCTMMDISLFVIADLQRLLIPKDGLTVDKSNFDAMSKMLVYVIFLAHNYVNLDVTFLHALLLNILLSGHICTEEAPVYLDNLSCETVEKLKANFAPFNEPSEAPFQPRIVHLYNAFQVCIRTIRFASSLVLPEGNDQVDGEMDRYLFGLKGSFIYSLAQHLAAQKEVDKEKDLTEYITENILTGKESPLAEMYSKIFNLVFGCCKIKVVNCDSGDAN